MKIKHLVAAVAVSAVATTTAIAGGHGDHSADKKMDAAHAMDTGTIVDIAASNNDFSTLVAAVTAADLAGVLGGEGPFTVFAPTNEAFAALPEGTVESLLLPENKDKLVQVLTYHVVSGAVYAKDVTQLSSADTVEGEAVKISTMGDKVMVNDAQVIAVDIAASNGVIHVIDKVLLPGA